VEIADGLVAFDKEAVERVLLFVAVVGRLRPLDNLVVVPIGAEMGLLSVVGLQALYVQHPRNDHVSDGGNRLRLVGFLLLK
jgi:hypothetical protein